MAQAILAFKRRHGHWDFIGGRKATTEATGRYATILRSDNESGNVPPRLVGLLDAAGFPWDAYEYRWQRMFDAVNASFDAEKRLTWKLMTWWRRQRVLGEAGELPANRSELLRGLNYRDPIHYHWMLDFNATRVCVDDGTLLERRLVTWLVRQHTWITNADVAMHWNRTLDIDEKQADVILKLWTKAQRHGLL